MSGKKNKKRKGDGWELRCPYSCMMTFLDSCVHLSKLSGANTYTHIHISTCIYVACCINLIFFACTIWSSQPAGPRAYFGLEEFHKKFRKIEMFLMKNSYVSKETLAKLAWSDRLAYSCLDENGTEVKNIVGKIFL